MQGKVVSELTAMLQSGHPAARQLAACTLGDLAYYLPDIAQEISAVSSTPACSLASKCSMHALINLQCTVAANTLGDLAYYLSDLAHKISTMSSAPARQWPTPFSRAVCVASRTTRFGSATKAPAKRILLYYRILLCNVLSHGHHLLGRCRSFHTCLPLAKTL